MHIDRGRACFKNIWVWLGLGAISGIMPSCEILTLPFSQDSYFVLKYDSEAVATAKESGTEKDEDGWEEAFDVSIGTMHTM